MRKKQIFLVKKGVIQVIAFMIMLNRSSEQNIYILHGNNF